MEIRYRREMKRNYLIVEPEPEAGPGYEARMLVNNSIEGLLRFHIKYMDEHQLYYYEITSMQPLGRLLESRFITREEICQLLVRLHVTLMRMEEYLLSEDGLLLEPEYIYVKPEWFDIGLCLVPGGPGDFPGQLSRLLQFLMKKVDHRDKESVVLAYGLYQESQKENYSIEDLMKLVQKDGRTLGNAADSAEMQTELEMQPELERQQAQPCQTQAQPHSQSQPAEPLETSTAGAGKKTLMYLLAGQAGLWCLVFIGGPAVIWLLRGPSLLKTYWKLGLGAAGMALAVIAVGNAMFLMLSKKGVAARQTPSARVMSAPVWEGDPWDTECSGGKENVGRQWEIPYQELETQETREPQEPQKPQKQRQQIHADKEPCFQTTLLATAESSGRRLEAGSPEAEDIELSYFPYIIGKQEDLVDYALKRQTVSRLHLRIDKEGEEYRITDLNSTNGTQVGGRLLEANETVAIRLGETLCIADLIYTFK